MSTAAATLPREPSHHVLLSALPDERLAKLAAQGSAPAFAAIYKRHHQDLYRYCQSIIGNEQDARDALQETMIKAMRALAGEPRTIALRPWLFRIAHNESVTLIRRRPPSTSIESIGELPAFGGEADLARERVRELFEDLTHLTPRQRGALVMRELNGLSFDEIATTMSMSTAAAKQTVYEARQALLDVAKGRQADCGEVRERISARDRRLLRGRGISAHLRSCADCREFEAGIAARGESLAAVAPLPAAASAGILQQVLGAAGGTAGGGGIAVAAAGGSLTAVAKLGVAGVVALGVGTIAIETRSPGSSAGSATGGGTAAPLIEQAAHSEPQSGTGSAGSGDGAAGSGAQGASDRGGAVGGADGQAGGGTAPADGGGAGAGTEGASTGQSTSPSNHPSDAAASNPEPGAAGGGGSGATTDGGSGTGSSGASFGESDVLPPGQGGTPPGQGGSPPGLDGQLPPGLGGTPPGLGGELPPGQGGTPPGQSGTAPGQSGNLPPGLGGTPPGQGTGHN